jgi:hypothetical protein
VWKSRLGTKDEEINGVIITKTRTIGHFLGEKEDAIFRKKTRGLNNTGNMPY